MLFEDLQGKTLIDIQGGVGDESRIVWYQHKAAVYLDSLEGK